MKCFSVKSAVLLEITKISYTHYSGKGLFMSCKSFRGKKNGQLSLLDAFKHVDKPYRMNSLNEKVSHKFLVRISLQPRTAVFNKLNKNFGISI